MSYGGGGLRYVGFQVHQKSSKSARIGSGKKMLKLLGTPIESVLRDSIIKRFVALVWSMLALAPVKKSTALLQTANNFRSFASIEQIFFLIAAEFDGRFGKLSHREHFTHPVARCCVDCRRFLACFCLYEAVFGDVQRIRVMSAARVANGLLQLQSQLGGTLVAPFTRRRRRRVAMAAAAARRARERARAEGGHGRTHALRAARG